MRVCKIEFKLIGVYYQRAVNLSVKGLNKFLQKKKKKTLNTSSSKDYLLGKRFESLEKVDQFDH